MQATEKVAKLIASLPEHTAQIVAEVIKKGVTPKLIDRAANAPKEEWQRYRLLRTLGSGNPAYLDALTELAMDDIRIALEDGELP